MSRGSRHVARLGVVLLAVRILVDMATPESPGAFRLDPETSVEAAAAPHQSVALAGPVQRLRIVARPMPVVPPRIEPRFAPLVRPLLALTLHRAESTGSPSAADDD